MRKFLLVQRKDWDFPISTLTSLIPNTMYVAFFFNFFSQLACLEMWTVHISTIVVTYRILVQLWFHKLLNKLIAAYSTLLSFQVRILIISVLSNWQWNIPESLTDTASTAFFLNSFDLKFHFLFLISWKFDKTWRTKSFHLLNDMFFCPKNLFK